MRIYHYDENYSTVEKLTLWGKFIIIMRIKYRDNIHDYDWTNSTLWLKFIIVMKIHNFDENSSLGYKFIGVTKFVIVMKIHQFIRINRCDEDSS